jgi:hypothetical protein
MLLVNEDRKRLAVQPSRGDGGQLGDRFEEVRVDDLKSNLCIRLMLANQPI